jgi:Holliday junction resolvase RusA-like endonuclease
MIDIEIDGPPIAWQRPGHKMLRNGEKNVSIIYDKQKKQKEGVKWQMMAQFREEKLTVPLLIDITFRMPIPKGASGALRTQMINGIFHHMKKPDVDNLTKFVLDCMNDLIFVDDSQICTLYCRKVFSSQPSTLIRIKPFTRNDLQKEADQIKELEEDEYNLRNPGWGENNRSCVDKKRYVFNTGEDDRLKPV